MRGFVGVCGSGKTYSMQRLVGESVRRGIRAKDGWRFVVLDVNSEWPEPEAMGAVKYTRARDEMGVRKELAAGKRLVIVQPKEPPGTPVPWASLADRLAAECIRKGSTILCLPEIQFSAPNGRPVPPNITALLTRFRHNRCGLWWDTQRIAKAPTMARDAATFMYYFAMATVGTEAEKLRKIGGDALLDAIKRASREASWGRPGYHVRLRPLDTKGPYRLRRL